MPLKTGNTVAVERRMDLASLFCMISRHGPAVALAVIAVISVVAGFIIYRTVRVKRRKATAAAAGGDNKNPGAPERDASVIREETHSSSAGSTDVSDEGSPDMKEDVVMIRSHLKLRHRPAAAAAAAEETPPHYSPLQRDLHLPDYKQTTSDNTEEVADAWDSYEAAETLAEEANQSLQSDGVTEMVLEEAVHCLEGEHDDVINDMLEEFHNTDVCLKEPINDEKNREEEKVLKAECQEGEDVTIDNTTRQEERTLNNPTSLHQTPHISEDSGDDRLQDHTTTNGIESNSEEPVVDIEALCVDCFCCGEDEEFENPDGIDDRVIGRISPEEGKKDEGEDQCLDHQLIGQQDDAWATTSEQETKLPSTLQDDDEMDKATILVGDRDEDGVLAGEEDIVEDHLNVTAVKVDTPLPQFNQQDVEVEQKEEKCLLCYQEDGVLYDGHDQVEEKMLTGDNIIACNEEQKSSSAALSTLACSDSLVKIDNHEEDLSGIANSSSDCQHPLKEEKTAVSFDEDTISSILRPEMPSHETENKPESNGNDTPVVSTVESNDDVYDLHSCKDQQNVQALRNEAFDEASIAAAPEILACRGDNIFTPNMAEVFNEAKITADPDTVENIPSIIVEEIASPHLPSICQDKEIEHVENNEASEEKIVTTADDADCTSSLKSDEPWIVNTKSDEPSSSQDQQSDQTKNEDLSQLTFCDSPEMIDDVNPPVCQIPFEQFAFRDNDISPAGVGEESGISSMTVSPDAGNEFDIISENMVLLVVDSELQSEGKTETQDNLYADDAAIAAIKVDTTGMVFGHSEQTDWTNNGQFSANEDMFGHEIEESYHRAMDQFMTQIADSITSITDELTKQTDVIDIVEIVEVKEKKAGVSVEKKEDAKADEKEEDYEKTEISIMEATMDHNEWIMDSNYQALPWMNLSVSSFSQKTNQLPAAECQCSSAGTDTISRDTDIPLSPEVKQIENPSIVDENTENNKKVVAVQPMPQNVNVTFRVHYFIQSPFQTVAVTGNQQELGNWKGFVPLERAKDGLWATVVSLPAESHVEWKFVVVDKGAVCRWEECGNRLLDTGCGDDLLVHRWWGLL